MRLVHDAFGSPEHDKIEEPRPLRDQRRGIAGLVVPCRGRAHFHGRLLGRREALQNLMARDGRFKRCLGLLGGRVDVFDEAVDEFAGHGAEPIACIG